MAITLSSGAVSDYTGLNKVQPTRRVKCTFACAGTYATGGITGIQTALRTITEYGGDTVVDVQGWCTNGTTYYPVFFDRTTGAAILVNTATGAQLANATDLTGYTLHLSVTLK